VPLPPLVLTLPEAVLLGILQGLTEFLPISSSGHLVLAQRLLGITTPGIVTEIVLHAGTLLAVLVVYRADLWRMARDAARLLPPRRARAGPAGTGARELGYLVAATLPVAVAGLLWRHPIEQLFESARTAAAFLWVTGLLLLLTRVVPRGRAPLRMRSALGMGVMQMLSLLPGLSRSGATISGGLFGRVDPAEVVRFAFLLSVPAILGSLLLELPEVVTAWSQGYWLPSIVGFLAALVSGMVAIQILIRVVARGRLYGFGIYCLAAGTLAFFVL
jgi:undecaprenyl-diphosphatase